MLKLSKKADYGLIAVRHLAKNGAASACSASDISEACGIAGPLMAKVLQKLAKAGLVVSRHGSGGGYQLARNATAISAFEVIDAIDGPLTITSCVTNRGECDQALTCTVREPLRLVNDSILQILKTVTISQMSESSPEAGLVDLPSKGEMHHGRQTADLLR
jgi:FeS assembly SUF system regulator